MKNGQDAKTENGSQSAGVVVRCADCVYWDDICENELDEELIEYDDLAEGICRRYPPDRTRTQPRTFDYQRCGEARKRI